MADQGGQEKTEKPTTKRRNDARKEGNLFQSKDAVTVLMLFGVFCILRLLLPLLYETIRDCMVYFFSAVGNENPLGTSPHIYI